MIHNDFCSNCQNWIDYHVECVNCNEFTCPARPCTKCGKKPTP